MSTWDKQQTEITDVQGLKKAIQSLKGWAVHSDKTLSRYGRTVKGEFVFQSPSGNRTIASLNAQGRIEFHGDYNDSSRAATEVTRVKSAYAEYRVKAGARANRMRMAKRIEREDEIEILLEV